MGKQWTSSSSSSGHTTTTVYYTNQRDNENNGRIENLVIMEQGEGRNRAASMVVDQPVGNDRTNSEIRRAKGKQKIGDIATPEELPRGKLGHKQTIHFQKSNRRNVGYSNGHVESQNSSLMYSRRLIN